MTQFNPGKIKKKSREEQIESNTFTLPPGGEYIVVGTHAGRQLIGQGTKKIRVRCQILEALNVPSVDDPSALVGKTFTIDLWGDMAKQGNAERLGHLCEATGNGDTAFDTDDDEDLVNVLTGVPFQIGYRLKPYGPRNAKKFDVDVKYTEPLDPKKAKSFTKLPDWDDMIPELSDRILEFKDYTNNGGGSRGGGGGGGGGPDLDSDPFADEDLGYS